MNDGNYGTHISSVRNEIMQVMKELSPKSIIPEAMFSRVKTADSQREVTLCMRKLCGEGVLDLSSGSENAYIINGAINTIVRDSSKQPNQIEKTKVEQLFDYLEKNGPTKTTDIIKKIGPSSYCFIQDLKKQNRIECIGKDSRGKIWAVVGTTKIEIDTPDDDRCESTSESLPTKSAEVETTMPEPEPEPCDLLDEDDFDIKMNYDRIAHIVDAMHKKLKSGHPIPFNWADELKRRIPKL